MLVRAGRKKFWTPGVLSAKAAAPAFAAFFNFRGTSAYVTDAAGQTYCISDAFPTSRAGLQFGWDAYANGADRDNSLDPRFAGINYATSGSTAAFTLTLPAPGVYKVDYALGDAGGYSQSTQVTIFDNTTAVNTGATKATSGTQYADIAGVVHPSPADWIATHAPAALTFASTVLKLALTGAGSAGVITHLAVTQ